MGDDGKTAPGLQELLGMGLVVAAALAVGLGLGWLVDSLLNTVPIFIMVGLLLGIVGAVAHVVRQFRKFL